MLNESGTLVARYTYNAWGEIISVTNANGAAITSSTHIATLNPLRYRGYYYDTETGFYYLQSRYYDPVTHRFINADSYASTGQGFVGMNMFAYCGNKPVMMTDHHGTDPGDLFETMDEAAEDFAQYTNGKSIEQNREYPAYIYTVVEFVPTSIKIGLFTITYFEKKVYYSYSIPVKGASDNTIVASILQYPIQKVALLHTHAAYSPEYNNDNFSDTDKLFAAISGVPYYVATPNGTLRKFDPWTWSDVPISDKIPYDPNHPEKRGK